MTPVAVLVHVSDIALARAWYQRAFPEAVARDSADTDVAVLSVGAFSIEIVRADGKVGSGKSGTVLYWSVVNLTESLSRLEALGATVYRGPMRIEHGLSMCQVEDPFGNLIGLRGPVL